MKKFLVVPAVVVLAFGLGACGGDSKDDKADGITLPKGATVSQNPDGSGGIQSNQKLTPEQLKMAGTFVACMRQLGYEMDEPSDPAFNFSPKNVQGMDQKQLLKVRQDAAQCSTKAGGSAMTGG